jgi:hypothetical protein
MAIMAFTFGWPWRRSVRTPKPRPRRRPPAFVPRLEALEDRTLLSVLTVTSAADNVAGSLRVEVSAAQDGDTIQFAPALVGQTIKLTSGAIPIDIGLTIQGPGAGKLAVSGSNAGGIFEIGQDSSGVAISGLTLKNGQSDLEGGAIFDDGAPLTLTSDTLSNNQAINTFAGVGSGGGALAVLGEATAGMAVTITNCRFLNNAAIGSAGGTVENGLIPVAGPGGPGQGGAIYLDAQFSAGLVLTVSGSSFVGNSAVGGAGRDDLANSGGGGGDGGLAQGGAVWIDAGAGAAQPLFAFSTDTFSKSAATGGKGGAGVTGDGGGAGGEADGGALYYTADFAAAPTLNVATSTFASNKAQAGAGAAGGAGADTGDSPGVGGDGGNGGFAQGGAVFADFQDSAAGSDNFTAVSFHANSALGGAGGAGGAGVEGGAGGNGGPASGGGLVVTISDVAAATQLTIAQSALTDNFAAGGAGGAGGFGSDGGGGGGFGGSTLGGGLYLSSLSSGGADTWTLDSDTIAANQADSGFGGNGGDGVVVGGDGGMSGLSAGGGVADGFTGSLEILHGAIVRNRAGSGFGGSGGAGLFPGADGARGGSAGGGLATDPLMEVACASADTVIADNSADLGDDVFGMLGSC